MQILKEEVRSNIIDAALQQFASVGFHHTAMKTIAAQANITPGNIYAYFKSKDDLLDAILSPTLIRLHESIEVISKGDDIDNVSFHLLAHQVTDLYLTNKEQFMILMTKAQHTRYEAAKQNIIYAIQQRVLLDLFPIMPSHQQNPILALTLAAALVEGLLTIFSCTNDESEVQCLVLQLMQVLFIPLTKKNRFESERISL